MPDNNNPAFKMMFGTDAAGENVITEPGEIDCDAAGELFDRFASAFETFDAAKVAELFAIPSVALGC
jgi:hypothetical protein